jgi:hypothetical protein
LRRVPAAESMLLACIFDIMLESRLTRSALRSRPCPAFSARQGSITANRPLPTLIPAPSVYHRAAAPLQDLSILRDLCALPDRFRKSLPSRVTRSAFAPRRLAIMNYHSATDQRSGSACFPLGSLSFLPLGTNDIMRLLRPGVKRKYDISAMNIHFIFNYLRAINVEALWIKQLAYAVFGQSVRTKIPTD